MQKATVWYLKAPSGLYVAQWGHGSAYTNRQRFAQRFATEAEAARNATNGDKPKKYQAWIED